jgi:hypothetical protein
VREVQQQHLLWPTFEVPGLLPTVRGFLMQIYRTSLLSPARRTEIGSQRLQLITH